MFPCLPPTGPQLTFRSGSGLKPKRKRHGENQLDPAELKQLLARGGSVVCLLLIVSFVTSACCSTERDIVDIERVEGLGAAPSKTHEHIPKLTLAQKEMIRMEQMDQSQPPNEGTVSSFLADDSAQS